MDHRVTCPEHIPAYYKQSEVYQNLLQNPTFKCISEQELLHRHFIRDDRPIDNDEDFGTFLQSIDFFLLSEVPTIGVDYFIQKETNLMLPEDGKVTDLLKKNLEKQLRRRVYEICNFKLKFHIFYNQKRQCYNTACGWYHSVGIHEDGMIVTWETNFYYQEIDSPKGRFRAFACGCFHLTLVYDQHNTFCVKWLRIGFHCVGIREDGMVVTWGNDEYGQRNDIPVEEKFQAIACGRNHSVGLRDNGSVVTWGDQRDGQRNDSPVEGRFVAIACGANHSVGLREDGSVDTWGNNDLGQRKDSPVEGRFLAIACGGYHSVGLREDGSVITWGSNDYGQRDDSPVEGRFVAIACGDFHTVGIQEHGSIVMWGNNRYGQRNNTPEGRRFVAVCCAELHSMGIQDDGTVVHWGSKLYGQQTDSIQNKFRMIVAGAM